MTELGAIVITDDGPGPEFYGRFRPISDKYQQEALDVCSRTREETLAFPDAASETQRLHTWLIDLGKRVKFISDNNGFDWQFVNYYLWRFAGGNPFGHSSTNLGSLYKGRVGGMFKSFKHLRVTQHTHHPLDDCKGNVEALLYMKRKLGLEISFKK